MSLTWKDAAATVLTALIVAGWLVVDSNRWAAAVVLALGVVSCSLGSAGRERMWRLPAFLGVAALVLGVLAIVTGSSLALALLVADDVVLWAVTTLRHARHGPRPAVA